MAFPPSWLNPARWSTECWSPAYFRARWRVWLHQRRHPDQPWLCLPAIDLLTAWIQPAHRILESGAGRSTVWFARRAAAVVSFEHDALWHAEVIRRLAVAGLRNADCRRAEGEAYWEEIARLPDFSFDLGLVDGIERHRVAEAMQSKIRPGGLLVIDDAQRYFPTAARLPGAIRARDPAREDHRAWEEFDRRNATRRRMRLSDGTHETMVVFV